MALKLLGVSPSVVSGSPTGGVPAWAASTEYKLNQIVSSNGVTYICLKAHTSGETFSGAGTNWAVLGGSSTANVLKALGEVEGNQTPNLAQGNIFTAKLKGNATFKKPTGWPEGFEEVLLLIEPNGHTLTVEGIENLPGSFATAGLIALPLFSKDGGTTVFLNSSAAEILSLAVDKTLGNEKGDLLGFSADNTPVRIPASAASGRILGADSAQSSGNRFLHRAELLVARPQIPTSGLYGTPSHSSRNKQVLASKSIMWLVPYDVVVEKEYDRIAVQQLTAAVGTSLLYRLGYYADDGTGLAPTGGALLDAGTISAEGANGEKSITIAKTLAIGRIWLALVLQGTLGGTNPEITGMTPLYCGTGHGSDLANSTYGSYRQEGVTGALPEIGSIAAASVNPLIGLRAK